MFPRFPSVGQLWSFRPRKVSHGRPWGGTFLLAQTRSFRCFPLQKISKEMVWRPIFSRPGCRQVVSGTVPASTVLGSDTMGMHLYNFDCIYVPLHLLEAICPFALSSGQPMSSSFPFESPPDGWPTLPHFPKGCLSRNLSLSVTTPRPLPSGLRCVSLCVLNRTIILSP